MGRENCLTPDQASDLLEERLPADEAEACASHFNGCAKCQSLAELLSDSEELREYRQDYSQALAPTPDWLADVKETLYALDDPPTTSARVNGSGIHENLRQSVLGRNGKSTHLGRFVLSERVGTGGFGVVYRAYDPVLHRDIALKLPRLSAIADPQQRRRFLAEAQAAAGLNHPNIIPVHEAGEVEGTYYLASAYCSGESLAEWLDTRPEHRATPTEAAEILVALAHAVEHAHRRGILHRDIKPANVLLDPDSPPAGRSFTPRLTDFGLARLIDSEERVTASGLVLGTPQYMAPEQVSGRREDVGPASDVHSLGAVLYELLTGKPPIDGEHPAAMLQRLPMHEPVPPRRLVPELPRDLEAICLKCLEKSPSRRYGSAGELASDLERFLAGEPTHARPITASERVFRWIKWHPAWGTAVATLATAVLTVIALLVLHGEALREVNESLEDALTDAQQARDRAEAEQLRNRQLLYASDIRLAWQAQQKDDLHQAGQILARHIPGPGEQDLRGFEWHYLWARGVEQHRSVQVSSEPLYTVDLAPDGKLAAVAGLDGLIRLYDPITLAERGQWSAGQGEVNGLEFSPNGEFIASVGEDGSVCIWRVGSHELFRRIDAHQDQVYNPRFYAAGERLATCGKDGSVHLWEWRTGHRLATLELPAGGPLPPVNDPDKANDAKAVELIVDGDVLYQRWSNGRIFRSIGSPVTGWERLLGDSPAHQIAAAGGRLYQRRQDGTVLECMLEDDRRWRVLDTNPGIVQISTGEALYQLRQSGEILRYAGQSSGRWELIGHERDTREIIAEGLNVYRVRNSGTVEKYTGPGLEDWLVLSTEADVIQVAADGDDLYRLLRDGSVWRYTGTPQKGWQKIGEGRSDILQVAADDRQLYCRVDGGVYVASGNPEADWHLMQKDLWSIQIAAGRNAVYQLHANGEIWQTTDRRPQAVESIAVAGDAKRLVCCRAKGAVDFWDLDSHTLVRRFSPLNHTVTSAAYLPDHRTVAIGGFDRSVQLRAETGNLLGIILHRDEVHSLCGNTGGTLIASGDRKGVIRLSSVQGFPDDPRLEATDRQWQAHQGRVYGLAFSPEGRRLLSVGSDGHLKVWPVAEFSREPVDHDGIGGFTFIPGTPLIMTLAHWDKADLRDSRTGEIVETFERPPSFPIPPAVFPDGKRAAIQTGNAHASIWDLVSRKYVEEWEFPQPFSWLRLSADGQWLAAGDADLVQVLNTASGRVVSTQPTQACNAAAWSPRAPILAIDSGDSIILWNIASGERRRMEAAHLGGVFEVEFSPDGESLASSGADRDVKLWQMPSGRLKAVLHGHQLPPTHLVFSPDGRSLVSGEEHSFVCKVWHVATEQQLWDLELPVQGSRRQLEFSPDGRMIVSLDAAGNRRTIDTPVFLTEHGEKGGTVGPGPTR